MIFVVEDDPTLLRMIGDYLAASGHDVERFERAEDALTAARTSTPDLVLTDVQLGSMSGIDLVGKLGQIDASILRVVMTAHGSVQTAVEAMRAGAFEFLEKPLDLARLARLVDRALGERRTARELAWVRGGSAELLLGSSPAMAVVRERIAALARVPSGAPPVLVQGETGVGKGVVAKALHRARLGERAPWIEVNCAALPATLIESELFGYERSAFTDARTAKPGLFEAADGGTLFLDEVGELPLEVQAKLLKVLEAGAVRRLGGLRDRPVRVEVIAASNVDLEKAVREGRFRADLFHRLAALPIALPPLRERGGDLLELAEAFLKELSARYRKPLTGFTASALAQLQAHDWPGNIRELRFALERAVLLAPPGATSLEAIPGLVAASPQAVPGQASILAAGGAIEIRLPSEGVAFDTLERAILQQAMVLAGQNVSQAARLLHLSRDTLRYRLRRYGLDTHPHEDG
ncbi:MAG: sigma-54-dependent Fis family transcriptional regulator [Myxococcales bacterium]|nr:sigma-54-dependent Fis family transcriptional regulator [Myxococcales bacterium]